MSKPQALLPKTQTSPSTIPLPRAAHTRSQKHNTQLTRPRNAQAPVLATQAGGHRRPRRNRTQAHKTDQSRISNLTAPAGHEQTVYRKRRPPSCHKSRNTQNLTQRGLFAILSGAEGARTRFCYDTSVNTNAMNAVWGLPHEQEKKKSSDLHSPDPNVSATTNAI